MSEQDKLYENISNAERLLKQKANMNAMVKTIGNLNNYYSATSSILRALDQYNNISKLCSINSNAIKAINAMNNTGMASSIMRAVQQYQNISKIANINNPLPQFGGAYAILRQATLLNSNYTKTFSALQRLSIQQTKIFGSAYNVITARNNLINSQNLSSVQKILDSHERIFSAIDKIEYSEDIDDKKEIEVKQLLSTVDNENIEEQIQIITQEPDLNTRIALFNAVLTVITLFTMIIIGVIAHNDSKVSSINQEAIISLLNKNIEIQEQQNELLEKIRDNEEKELSINKEQSEKQAKLLQELLNTTKVLETKLSEDD